MKLYISGPMTGKPDLNYPAFDAEAQYWRGQNHEVMNPAENPEPPCKSWSGYMRMSVMQIAQCDAMALLPGWEKSKGARLERRLALDLNLLVIYPKEEAAS